MRRKIIEIYATENDDTVSFDFEKVDDSEVANDTMKLIMYVFKTSGKGRISDIVIEEGDCDE